MDLIRKFYYKDDILIAEIAGELTAISASDFQDATRALLSAQTNRVILDMAGLNFLSSAGIRVLITLLKETRRLGGDLRLARLQPAVHDVIAMTMSKLIQTFDTLPGSLSSFHEAKLVSTDSVSRNSTPTQRQWSQNFLDMMRKIGDPAADQAVQELLASEQVTAVNRLMKILVTNDHVPPSDLPPVIRDYLDKTTQLPSWTDWSRIKRGQHFFERHGVQIVTILFCGSLPMSYAARKGAHVLAMTQRMNRDPYRRIIETAQLILDVMTPGGLQLNGTGLRSAQKVRLMHAAVRQILLNSGHWDTAVFDYPINQEDMAGTLMAFSHAINVGLPMLGVSLTREQEDDYNHIWNVVGSLMGISNDLLPANTVEAKILSDTITSRHIGGTPADNLEGQELTIHLIRMMQEKMPSRVLDDLPKALIRYLAGDRVGDLLGIDPVSWQGAIKSFQWANELVEHGTDNVIIGRVVSVVFRQVMNNLMRHNLAGQRASFSIPKGLAQQWGINRPDSKD